MYLAYIDESGRPIKGVDGDIYVLSCLMVHEHHWQYIDNHVKQIKIKHFPNLPPEEIEIHAKDMLNRAGLFNGMSFEKIYAVFSDIFNFIAGDKTNLTAISIIINKSCMHDSLDADEWAYRLLVERINNYLSQQNRERIDRGLSVEYGIMIIDSCGLKADGKLRKKITAILKSGTAYSNLRYLIEDPLFTDSKWRNLSQLIDCIAYATKKMYKETLNPSFHDIYWWSYFKKIYGKFYCDKNGNPTGRGLKIFP